MCITATYSSPLVKGEMDALSSVDMDIPDYHLEISLLQSEQYALLLRSHVQLGIVFVLDPSVSAHDLIDRPNVFIRRYLHRSLQLYMAGSIYSVMYKCRYTSGK